MENIEDKVIIAKYQEFNNCRCTAEYFGCSAESIRRVLVKHNIPRTKPKEPKKEPKYRMNVYTDAELIDAYKKYGSQIAAGEALGVSQTTVYRALKRNGFLESRYVKCAYCGKLFLAKQVRSSYCSRKCKDISLRLAKGIPCNPNVEPYHKICVVCGKPFDSFRDTAVTCSHECAQKHRTLIRNSRKKASDKTWTEWLEELELRKEQSKEQKELQKARKQLINVLSASINKMQPRVCKECGKIFYSQYPTKLYCDKKCQAKHHRGHDKRIPKSQIVDTDISLQRLYRRDGGKCYLCGCRCDFKDWRVSESGNKYPGDTYPTKDHVIPVSMGGKESWENVRLACWKCNLEKSDSIVGIAQMPSNIARRERYIPNKKKTAQYSLDGTLIRIWDSTADIRRELGLNDTNIQNVCCRYKSNTGNAYGYHWEYVENEQSKIRIKPSRLESSNEVCRDAKCS